MITLTNKTLISIIVCTDQNGIIGNSETNKMPWPHNKEDMKFFKEKTINRPVIMGRKTFQSIGQPLKDRLNIVITRNKEAHEMRPEGKEGPIFIADITQAIDLCDDLTNEIFVIGGRSIYDEYIKNDLVDRMYINVLNETYKGDVDFPYYNKNDWIISPSEIKYESFKSYVLIRKNDL
jgi:dihydrofolate reductase